jgi:hypothetical protein
MGFDDLIKVKHAETENYRVILNYPHGPNVLARVFIRETGK